MPHALDPLSPGAPAVCQCIGPHQMPASSVNTSAAALMVRYVDSDEESDLQKLCRAAVTGATERSTELDTAGLNEVLPSSAVIETRPTSAVSSSRLSTGSFLMLAGIAVVMTFSLMMVRMACRNSRCAFAASSAALVAGDDTHQPLKDIEDGDAISDR